MSILIYAGIGVVVLIIIIASFVLGGTSYSSKSKTMHGNDRKDWQEETNRSIKRTIGRK